MQNKDQAIDTGQRAGFQVRAAKSIEDVLVRSGIAADFEEQNDTRYVEFDWKGRLYTVAIFAGEMNMREGRNLYECYLREEFASKDVYINSFCSRLERFLRDGEWKAPREHPSRT